MRCPQYILDELFPVKIHHNEHYLPYELTTNEKLYLELYNNAKGDTRKVRLVMEDMLSSQGVEKIKMHLIDLGLITPKNRLNTTDAKEFTIENSHKGLICEWCGRESYILHRHHYPILASQGGKDTVRICPNCHSTYHIIMGDRDNE